MDIPSLIKEKTPKKEALVIVYQEPDGYIKFYTVIPYLFEQSYFQGLTKKGTISFQLANVLAVQEEQVFRITSWQHIKAGHRLIVMPGKRVPVGYRNLCEDGKHLVTKAFFAGQLIRVQDYIFVEQGER